MSLLHNDDVTPRAVSRVPSPAASQKEQVALPPAPPQASSGHRHQAAPEPCDSPQAARPQPWWALPDPRGSSHTAQPPEDAGIGRGTAGAGAAHASSTGLDLSHKPPGSSRCRLTLLHKASPMGALAMQSCEEQRLNNHASWAKLATGSNPFAIWLSQGGIWSAEKDKLLLIAPNTHDCLCAQGPGCNANAFFLGGQCGHRKKDPIQATKNI